MATAPSPPILIWAPGGGVPVGPVSNPPVYSQADITQLVAGQAYIDVVFGSVQTDTNWVLVECEIVNTTDLSPLNIWPGITTSRTAAGFRLQLNGLPDSPNYFLHWAVSGVNIVPVPATSYLLTGPTSAGAGTGVIYTVRLPPSTTVSGPITITPSDGGAGGSFDVDSVVLTTASASATFTYSTASYGARTISTTNSGTLIDPAGIVLSIATPTYTLTGPSSGNVGSASTNFTVTLIGSVLGTMIVTPNDSGVGTAGTFTPSTVSLTTGAPVATFTYTPASGGTKMISVTNNKGLVNPGSISYNVISSFDPSSIAGLKLWLKADSLALTDGTAVATWPDSSGLANNATQTGTAQPIFKTNIVNGKPVVRFDGVNDNMVLGTSITIALSADFVLFVVHKTTGDCCLVGTKTAASANQTLRIGEGGINELGYNVDVGGTVHSGGLTVPRSSWNTGITRRVSGTIQFYDSTGFQGGGAMPNAADLGAIGALPLLSALYTTGDIPEVLFYDNALSGTDFNAVHGYLKTKYAIP